MRAIYIGPPIILNNKSKMELRYGMTGQIKMYFNWGADWPFYYNFLADEYNRTVKIDKNHLYIDMDYLDLENDLGINLSTTNQ